MGWDPDYATGASADSCWFLFAGDLQSAGDLSENFSWRILILKWYRHGKAA